VGVAIDSTALVEPSGDPMLRRAVHEELLEELVVHGTLVFASDDDLAAFVAAVRALPPTLAKAWEVMISTRRLRVEVAEPAVAPGVDDVLDLGVLERGFGDDLQLALLQGDHAELVGVPVDAYSVLGPAGLVEAGRLATGVRTSALRAAREVLDAPMREGVNREVEWEQRFGPLVAASKLVVVFDRYVGQQAARRYIYGQQATDGLTWFLSRVAMTPGRHVRIITAVSDDVDRRGWRFDEDVVSQGLQALERSLGRPLSLDVVLVPDRVKAPPGSPHQGVVERFGHDRHVRFGDRVALALGTGVQVFAPPRVAETVTVARLPLADAKAREHAAEKGALRPPPGGWLQPR
jgi:hypothetical protein